MAAGGSSRFGKDKLAVVVDGATVLERVIRVAESFGEVIVVVRERRKEVEKKRWVLNPNWKKGISTSVKLAINEASKMKCDVLLFFLGDMPCVEEECARSVIKAASEDHERLIFYPKWGKSKGFPTALKKEGFYLAKMLTGDQGLKRIINSMPHLCRPVLIANESCYKDIDTPRDIRF